jgi:hypothetical protein
MHDEFIDGERSDMHGPRAREGGESERERRLTSGPHRSASDSWFQRAHDGGWAVGPDGRRHDVY